MKNDFNNISVAELMMRPIDPSSKLTHIYPGEDLFDKRQDFLLFKNMTHLAVFVTVINESVMEQSAQNVQAELTVNLDDVFTGERVTSGSVVVALGCEELSTGVRVDLPFAYAEADSAHLYRVSVTNGESDDCVLAEREMHLFDIPGIKILPTKWFYPEHGWVAESDSNLNKWSRLRNIASTSCDMFDVVFELQSNLPANLVWLPELEMRVVYPDGQAYSEFCQPERVASDDDECIVRVSMQISMDDTFDGVHYAELRCMGYAFTGFLFNTKCESECGSWSADEMEHIAEYTPFRGARFFKTKHEAPDMDKPVVDEPDKLDLLVGLGNVKRKLTEYTQLVRFNQLRQQAGLPVQAPSLHAMFLGSPGTGKTTVAKIMGDRLHKAGVLSKGHVVVKERATLIGKYYNSESENVLQALEEAQGGILFIDEAYQLYQPQDNKDPGRFVIETLLTALADESRRDWMLILAGYTQPMQEMFKMNPGLRSRIPSTNIYVFDDFTEGELMEIAERYFAGYRFLLDNDARESLSSLLAHDYANRGADFGNARHVMNLIQSAILPNMAMRLASVKSPTPKQLSRIEASDIPLPTVVRQLSRPTVGFNPLSLAS